MDGAGDEEVLAPLRLAVRQQVPAFRAFPAAPRALSPSLPALSSPGIRAPRRLPLSGSPGFPGTSFASPSLDQVPVCVGHLPSRGPPSFPPLGPRGPSASLRPRSGPLPQSLSLPAPPLSGGAGSVTLGSPPVLAQDPQLQFSSLFSVLRAPGGELPGRLEPPVLSSYGRTLFFNLQHASDSASPLTSPAFIAGRLRK